MVLSGMTLAGCSKGPGRITQPKMSASSVGSGAIATYDTDGDGFIAGDELKQAVSLRRAAERIDTDGDGKLSATEIAQRVEVWKAARTGLTNVMCVVTMDGRPVDGAEVVFEPEEFLGGNVKQAVSPTNYLGMAAPTVAKEDRPVPHAPPGMAFGFYKVRISGNDRIKIPSRYNEETVIGYEVAPDDPGVLEGNVRFNLKSK